MSDGYVTETFGKAFSGNIVRAEHYGDWLSLNVGFLAVLNSLEDRQ